MQLPSTHKTSKIPLSVYYLFNDAHMAEIGSNETTVFKWLTTMLAQYPEYKHVKTMLTQGATFKRQLLKKAPSVLKDTVKVLETIQRTQEEKETQKAIEQAKKDDRDQGGSGQLSQERLDNITSFHTHDLIFGVDAFDMSKGLFLNVKNWDEKETRTKLEWFIYLTKKLFNAFGDKYEFPWEDDKEDNESFVLPGGSREHMIACYFKKDDLILCNSGDGVKTFHRKGPNKTYITRKRYKILTPSRGKDRQGRFKARKNYFAFLCVASELFFENASVELLYEALGKSKRIQVLEDETENFYPAQIDRKSVV